ncbi:ABC transporter permease subunit [Stappia sp. BW2]|uniref:ABC transporter permease subunit n=1 Tax=Stappia sp. BW2 TaxID=2592622 RepID=UPI0011DE5A30|nr:ABC transporter permease subunit [Stappia sp. BW2]TYC64654.1 ABC transporter permease subunit [Stappia sp. BW2]
MIPPSPPPPAEKRLHLSDIAAVGGLALVLALAVFNVLANMEAAGVSPGFGFLVREAGFDVSSSLIPYAPSDSYARVILVGLANTVFLAAVCLVLATVIGVVFGLVSVGPSPIGRALALAYVEVFRNLPKLLVLLILFVLAVNGLPHVREAISVGPFHLSNRSVNFPVVVSNQRMWFAVAAAVVGLGIGFLWRARHKLADRRSGAAETAAINLLPIALPLLAILVFQVPVTVSVPELKGFDFQGGGRLSLQFVVIAATLGIYHGAQIAEVVRGGLLAIPKGQTEAAKALGLTPWQSIRLIVLPQVIRIVIPPMNNQYVNLVKNTSIAIAVGYSDLMSVSGTIINQSFKPLEMMLITMGLYLALCLGLTTTFNRFHRRLTRRETR